MEGIVAHHARGGHRDHPARPVGTDQGHPRWCRAADVRTVGAVDLAAPPAGTNPTPLPEPPGGQRPPDPDSQRIVAGVAALIGERLGIDPLWIRIGFVVLALAGGIGVLVYAGLWLVLIAGRSSGREWPRYAGAVLLLGILPLILNGGSFDLMTGPFAVILLLVGLTLALWQPRLAAPRRASRATRLRSPRQPPT